MKAIFPRSNPSVVYRIERVNSFLKTADNMIRLLIAPKCKYLVKDLYSITWKEGERTQDKKNPELTHMSDALGYLLVSHEDSESANQVVIMREKEIQATVALHQEQGYFVSPKVGKPTATAFAMVR